MAVGKKQFLFYQIFLHGENGKIMKIQSEIEEFEMIIKTSRFEVGAGSKPKAHNFFS